MNKRGNVALEITLILVLLVAFIVMFPVIYSNLTPFINSFTGSAGFSAESVAGLDNFHDKMPRMMDNIFLMMLLLFWMGGLLLAFFVDTHPAFFGISMVLIIVVLWSAVFLGDFAEDFINNEAVTIARDKMPIITFVAGHILEFMVAISLTMLLALYGRTSRGSF